MIKNTLIFLLSISFIALSWMAFSGADGKAGLLATIQKKVEAVKKASQSAANHGAFQGLVTDRKTGSDEKSESKKTTVAVIKKDKIERELEHKESESNKKIASESSAAEVLGGISQKHKKKPGLTSEDLNSVLSILKSAQELLRKTSFNPRPAEKDTPVKNPGLEEKIIKKNHPMVSKDWDRSQPCPCNGPGRIEL